MNAAFPTPFTDVNAILLELHARAQAILQEQWVGMYLYGSLALGDFDPTKSDIDFLIVTEEELLPPTLEALQAMHRELGLWPSKWAEELEGSYISRALLRRYDPTQNMHHAHIDRGASDLMVMEHHTDWVIQRYSLREFGITLSGPAIQSLIDPISGDDLRAALLDLLWWWDLQLVDSSRIIKPGYQVYAIISMCRILYTFEMGTIISKPAAAHWALQSVDPCWHNLIGRALQWQPDQPMDQLTQTQNWIRYTLSTVRNWR